MAVMERARGSGGDEDFYEDDEPLEKIVAAFEHGEHGVTAPSIHLDTHGLTPERHTSTQPGIVTLHAASVEPLRPVAVQAPA
jgi:hypothetical protein